MDTIVAAYFLLANMPWKSQVWNKNTLQRGDRTYRGYSAAGPRVCN